MREIFQLTYVEYPSGILGFSMALITLLPLFLFFSLIVLYVFSKNFKILFLSLGLLLSTVFNEILKILIKQPRPANSYKKGFGMPSDHSQFMIFYTTAVALTVTSSRIKLLVINIISSILVIYSRVFLEVHTWEQVFIGALLGFILAFIYSKIINIKLFKK